ncbi:FliM/FliN family flagellar motor switch protein [Sulfitobacter faviae]|uniref:Flagellar motor switch protein FliM n=1 Tax=Sulfitobacter faviae TaxID=1775881 RepID=A0ABZ0V649_9RHOB|nr:FliM/FliN family flagellar motor switch protein [Sulfitobacter faviae]WPZ22517.1 FliM/FliN family flagellar motor switch protein [Sulfitobacter faviae]
MTIAASPDALSLEETMIRQARESFQRLPTLEIIIDRLLLALVPDLKSYCTVAPEIELSSLEYMPYEDAMESIQSPSLIAIANAESWGSQIACVVEPDLLFSVLEIMLGGRRATSQQWKPRGLTAIEQKLGRRLAELSLKGLAHCLTDVSPVQFDIQSLESNPRSVMLAAPRTATVLVRLHMQFEDRSGHMALVLPYGTLDEVSAQLAQPFLGGRSPTDSNARKDMNSQISSTTVTITGVLQQVTIPLHEVLEWKPGQVIDLGMTVDTPVVGMVNAQPMFQAAFGQRSNGALALRVIQSLLPKENQEDSDDDAGLD